MSAGAFLALFLVLSAACVFALVETQRVADRILALDELRIAAGTALQLSVDAETGLRGYAATGDRAFLRPYLDAQEKLPAALAALRRAAAATPRRDDDALVRDFETTRTRWEAEMAGRLLAQPYGPPPLATQARAKRLIDRLRRDVDGIRFHARDEVQRLTGWLRTASFAASGLAAVWLLAIGVIFVRMLRRGDEREAALVASLAAREAEATHLSRWRATLIGMLAHDFKAKLAVIVATAERLRDVPSARGDERSYAGLENAGRALATMTDETLVFAKAAGGALSVEPGCVDLVKLVEDARLNHPSRAIRLAAGDESLWAYGDESLLGRAVANLVSNAVKYSPDGTAVDVRLWRDGDLVRLAVSDAGAGIAGDDLPHLFEEWWRSRSAGRGAGHGMGLFIVKKIVDAHGGTILVATRPGRGTTVVVAFPAAGSLLLAPLPDLAAAG